MSIYEALREEIQSQLDAGGHGVLPALQSYDYSQPDTEPRPAAARGDPAAPAIPESCPNATQVCHTVLLRPAVLRKQVQKA